MNNQLEISKSYEKCQSCGGNMIYSPQYYDLKCKSCEKLENIATSNKINKHIYYEGAENQEEYKEWKNQKDKSRRRYYFKGNGCYRCKDIL